MKKLLIAMFFVIVLVKIVSGTEGYNYASFDLTALNTNPTGACNNGTDIWVTDDVDDEIYHYLLDGSYVDSFDTNAAGNTELQGCTNNGTNLFTGDRIGGKTYIWDLDGTAVSNHANNVANGIRGIGSNATALFYADITNDQIYAKTYAGGAIYDFDTASSTNEDPVGIAVNETNAWVLDNNKDKVFVYDLPSGNYAYNWSLNVSNGGGRGLGIDSVNGLFITIADGDNDKLYIYNSSTPTLSPVTTTLEIPADEESFSLEGLNFTASLTSTGSYLIQNATTWIWYTNGTLFNSTTNSSINPATNQSIIFIDSFTLNDYKWNVLNCANNATGTLCNWGDTNYTFYIGANIDSQTYSSSVSETSYNRFEINVTLVSDTILYQAIFVYNNTNYTGTIIDLGSDKYSLSTYTYAPEVTTTEDIDFYWIINYESEGGKTQTISTLQQEVLDLSAIQITSGVCGGGYFEALNYEFQDAQNITDINVTLSYNFKYGIGNLTTKELYGNFTNKHSFKVCVNETIGAYKLGYGEIDYQTSGYSERRFYMFEGYTLSNVTTQNYTLYDLVSSSSTSFLFEIQDNALEPAPEKILHLLRWFPELNEYKIVEAALTDEDGLTIMKVEVEDVDYRIGVYDKNGTLLKLAPPVRMACLINPCTYTLKVLDEETNYLILYDIQYSLVYNSALGKFVFTWNDPSQTTSQMRLHVYKDAGFQNIEICNNTGEGYVGVLTCDTGNYSGNLFARAYRSASPEEPFATLVKTIGEGVQSAFGLFLGFILALSAGLIGIASPITAVILVIIGLIPVTIFGGINYTIFMGILALGGIIIHYLMKR